jgi:hypothetical protein
MYSGRFVDVDDVDDCAGDAANTGAGAGAGTGGGMGGTRTGRSAAVNKPHVNPVDSEGAVNVPAHLSSSSSSSSAAAEGVTDGVGGASNPDIYVCVRRELDDDERRAVRRFARQKREERTILNTQPVFQFEFGSLTVSVNEGKVESGSDIDDTDSDDDDETYTRELTSICVQISESSPGMLISRVVTWSSIDPDTDLRDVASLTRAQRSSLRQALTNYSNGAPAIDLTATSGSNAYNALEIAAQRWSDDADVALPDEPESWAQGADGQLVSSHGVAMGVLRDAWDDMQRQVGDVAAPEEEEDEYPCNNES